MFFQGSTPQQQECLLSSFSLATPRDSFVCHNTRMHYRNVENMAVITCLCTNTYLPISHNTCRYWSPQRYIILYVNTIAHSKLRARILRSVLYVWECTNVTRDMLRLIAGTLQYLSRMTFDTIPIYGLKWEIIIENPQLRESRCL